MKAKLAAVSPEAAEEIVCPNPEVPVDVGWIWRAFWRLDASRPILSGGMSAPVRMPIPLRDIVMWADIYDYDEEQFEFLDTCIQAMDSEYLDQMSKQASVNTQTKGKAMPGV